MELNLTRTTFVSDHRFFHRFGFMDLGNPPVFLYGRLFLVNNNNKIYDTNYPATTCRWRRYL